MISISVINDSSYFFVQTKLKRLGDFTDFLFHNLLNTSCLFNRIQIKGFELDLKIQADVAKTWIYIEKSVEVYSS